MLQEIKIADNEGEKGTDTMINKDVLYGLALGSIVVNPSGESLPCIFDCTAEEWFGI